MADDKRAEVAGLSGVGSALSGTDARPRDPLPNPSDTLADDYVEGGENELQDARRAHGAAEGDNAKPGDLVDETRAHVDDSASDNGEL